MATTTNDVPEPPRFGWRIVPAFLLFVSGAFLAMGGLMAIAGIVYGAVRGPLDPKWLPVMLLSYCLVTFSGLLLIIAAYCCAVGRRWTSAMLASVAAGLYGCFFLVFPGPV